MANREFTVVLEPNDPDPGFTATVPALPGCLSVGATIDGALVNVRDAIELWISMARKKGEAVPEDYTVVSKVQVAA
jgi:antitoxin HicB